MTFELWRLVAFAIAACFFLLYWRAIRRLRVSRRTILLLLCKSDLPTESGMGPSEMHDAARLGLHSRVRAAFVDNFEEALIDLRVAGLVRTCGFTAEEKLSAALRGVKQDWHFRILLTDKGLAACAGGTS